MSQPAKVVYARTAEKALQRLDRQTAERIKSKIAENAAMDDPLTRAEVLLGQFAGLYRYRIGSYRAVFAVSSTGVLTLLTIIAVEHRKDVYR